MTKRWLNSPRMALGCLALVSALSLAVNAPAETLRNGGTSSSGPLTAVFGPSSTQASGTTGVTGTPPPPIFNFGLAGSGLTTFSNPQSDCTAAGFTCTTTPSHCNCVETTGTLSDGQGPFFNGPYVFIYNVDQDSRFNNGSRQCFAASGLLSLTRPQGTIQFQTAGIACNFDGGEYSTFGGAFAVTGTGAFSAAAGAGDIEFTDGNLTGTFPGPFQSQIDLDGAGSNLN